MNKDIMNSQMKEILYKTCRKITVRKVLYGRNPEAGFCNDERLEIKMLSDFKPDMVGFILPDMSSLSIEGILTLLEEGKPLLILGEDENAIMTIAKIKTIKAQPEIPQEISRPSVITNNFFNGINLNVARTGRISCNAPNISNIAKSVKDIIKDDKTPEERRAFMEKVNREHYILDFDLTQIQYRIQEAQRMGAYLAFYGFTKKQIKIIKEYAKLPQDKDMSLEEIIELFKTHKEDISENQEFYTDTESCTKCGGRCCKKTSCLYSPSDLKEVTYESIRELIDSGKASIDWMMDSKTEDGRYYFFLRVREVGGNALDPSYGKPCSMLTEKGCKFNYAERPKGGRLLRTTVKIGECHSDYDKEQAKEEWFEYEKILHKLFYEYSNGKSPDEVDMDSIPDDVLDRMWGSHPIF